MNNQPDEILAREGIMRFGPGDMSDAVRKAANHRQRVFMLLPDKF